MYPDNLMKNWIKFQAIKFYHQIEILIKISGIFKNQTVLLLFQQKNLIQINLLNRSIEVPLIMMSKTKDLLQNIICLKINKKN